MPTETNPIPVPYRNSVIENTSADQSVTGRGVASGALNTVTREWLRFFNAISSGVQSGASLTADNTFTGTQTYSDPAKLVFGSGYQSFTPTLTPVGSMTAVLTGGAIEWLRIGPMVTIYAALTVTLGGSLGAFLNVSLPVGGAVTMISKLDCAFSATGHTLEYMAAYVDPATQQMVITAPANFPVSGSYTFYISGSYRAA